MNVEYTGYVLGKVVEGVLYNLSPSTTDNEIIQILAEMGVTGIVIVSKK